jgi:hypothetical protein
MAANFDARPGCRRWSRAAYPVVLKRDPAGLIPPKRPVLAIPLIGGSSLRITPYEGRHRNNDDPVVPPPLDVQENIAAWPCTAKRPIEGCLHTRCYREISVDAEAFAARSG